ncbi:MAG: heme-binding protein [Alphaproteobacteria bacterium]|jgi:uncharacterized protein GlcG (DUF336 family)|nr:heme-binding protein [Alphaproteobacteria bacterium]MDP6564286.1 heme-binding protein [Alphaproteobacteria bacterium]MDP6811847.1 heme-binding protein [Alphaproteobacteria bacterium]
MAPPKLFDLKTDLPLAAAAAIIDGALAAGRAADMLPLTVAVLDAGGHLIALQRQDGSGILRVDIAIGKAWGALGMGIPSRTIGERLGQRPAFQGALVGASNGRFVPVPGGVLVLDGADRAVGAVGISGDTSDKDEYCAIVGIKQAGFTSAPAEPAEDWQQSGL